MTPKGFAERFLEHIDKLDRSQIADFLKRTVRERDFIARIFDALTDGVVVFDAEARVTLVNPAARRILRWPKNRKIPGESLLDMLEDGPLKDLVGSFQDAPRSINNREILFPQQANRMFVAHLVPIAKADEASDADWDLASAALILQDVTVSRDKQVKNAQAEKLASLVTLTAGVAHEIKNPLNSLSIHAQLLDGAIQKIVARQKGGEQTAERILQSCDIIGEEVERLRQCVDDFIEAARPRKPSFCPMDLNRIVEDLARSARLEFESKGIELKTRLDPDLPVLQLDEKQIRSALRNLLRNALDAVEGREGDVDPGLVMVRTRSVGDTVSLEVSDNGLGISDADMPKLFEPYFTTKFNGSGLGLMAVARIVREHNGVISINSDAGRGATFTLEFPAASRRVKLLEGTA